MMIVITLFSVMIYIPARYAYLNEDAKNNERMGNPDQISILTRYSPFQRLREKN